MGLVFRSDACPGKCCHGSGCGVDWHLGCLGAPLCVGVLWFVAWLWTPRDGVREPTIRGTPGMTLWVSWVFGCAILSFATLYWDNILLGRPSDARVKTYQSVAVWILLVAMVIGAGWIPHYYKWGNRRRNDES